MAAPPSPAPPRAAWGSRRPCSDRRSTGWRSTLVNPGGYRRIGGIKRGLDIRNLLDARDDAITYRCASRLPGERAEGVGDDHLHPVEPRQVRGSLRWLF